MEKEKIEHFYFQMLLIRRFEEKLYKLFSEGKLFGTTHGYIGQEANAVGIISNLKTEDIIFSNHRCHGHYLARTNDVKGLLAEIMGKSTGTCGGIGGSQHIYANNFYTNGVQGSYMPIITGMALAEKMKKSKNIVIGFIGDGTLGEGAVYESLNLMSLLQVPCLIVVENNQYAQSTRISKIMAGTIKKRFEAFDIQTEEITTTNVLKVFETSKKIIEKIRSRSIPYGLIINTYRLCSHSISDDFRDQKEIEEYKKRDPLKITENILGEETIIKIEDRITSIISEAEEEGIKAEFLDLSIK